MLNPGYLVIALIIAGLIGWGAFHAVGAYSLNQNPWRGAVVMGFSLAFVGFWLALLAWRGNRTK
jgi:hypothetical protein